MPGAGFQAHLADDGEGGADEGLARHDRRQGADAKHGPEEALAARQAGEEGVVHLHCIVETGSFASDLIIRSRVGVWRNIMFKPSQRVGRTGIQSGAPGPGAASGMQLGPSRS